MFEKKVQGEIRELHRQLKAILDEDRNERVMIFTDDKEIRELAAQINRLLEEKAKSEADFRRSEIASRKMLSNISHDLKTPLTVIRGYLEIMRTRGEAALEEQTDLQMLLKAEQKTQALMELIDSFFFFGKAGGRRYADRTFFAGCL